MKGKLPPVPSPHGRDRGRPPVGGGSIQYLDRKIQKIQTALAQVGDRNCPHRPLYLQGTALPPSATGGTLEGELLELLGFESATGSDSGWRFPGGLLPTWSSAATPSQQTRVKTAYPNAQLIRGWILFSLRQQSPSLPVPAVPGLGHGSYTRTALLITRRKTPEVFNHPSLW